jgi:hypothetical protein
MASQPGASDLARVAQAMRRRPTLGPVVAAVVAMPRRREAALIDRAEAREPRRRSIKIGIRGSAQSASAPAAVRPTALMDKSRRRRVAELADNLLLRVAICRTGSSANDRAIALIRRCEDGSRIETDL